MPWPRHEIKSKQPRLLCRLYGGGGVKDLIPHLRRSRLEISTRSLQYPTRWTRLGTTVQPGTARSQRQNNPALVQTVRKQRVRAIDFALSARRQYWTLRSERIGP
eukprot:1940082-Rhodomonas_salina.2